MFPRKLKSEILFSERKQLPNIWQILPFTHTPLPSQIRLLAVVQSVMPQDQRNTLSDSIATRSDKHIIPLQTRQFSRNVLSVSSMT